MKLVIGIVRPEKTNEVLEALYRAEVRGFSMSRVQGHGGELDRVETYRGTTRTHRPGREGPLRDRRIRRVRRAGDRGAVRGRPDRRRSATARSSCSTSSRSCGSAAARKTTPPSPRWVPDMAAGSERGRHRLDAHRHRAGAADDAGAGPLLRRPRAGQEHAQHVHDVHRRAGDRDDHVGADRLLARVLARQRADRRLRPRRPERRRVRAARGHDDPAPAVHGLPGHVLHHHHRAGRGRGRRADALRRRS